MDEAAVVVGFFVVADQDRPAFLQPGEGALDDPAAGGVGLLAGLVEFLFADPSDVREVAGRRSGRVSGWVVVALVEAEVLLELAGIRALDDDRVDGRLEQLGVVDVGAGELDLSGAAGGALLLVTIPKRLPLS